MTGGGRLALEQDGLWREGTLPYLVRRQAHWPHLPKKRLSALGKAECLPSKAARGSECPR